MATRIYRTAQNDADHGLTQVIVADGEHLVICTDGGERQVKAFEGESPFTVN